VRQEVFQCIKGGVKPNVLTGDVGFQERVLRREELVTQLVKPVLATTSVNRKLSAG
jgi:hypothetical protein